MRYRNEGMYDHSLTGRAHGLLICASVVKGRISAQTVSHNAEFSCITLQQFTDKFIAKYAKSIAVIGC